MLQETTKLERNTVSTNKNTTNYTPWLCAGPGMEDPRVGSRPWKLCCPLQILPSPLARQDKNSHLSLFRFMFSKKNMHCNENPINVFPEKEMRGMCLWAIYIYPGSIHISSCSRTPRSWEYINRSQTHECGKLAQFLFWEYLFQIFDIVSLQCGLMKTFYFSKNASTHNNSANSDVSKFQFRLLAKCLSYCVCSVPLLLNFKLTWYCISLY